MYYNVIIYDLQDGTSAAERMMSCFLHMGGVLGGYIPDTPLFGFLTAAAGGHSLLSAVQ